jgi:YVTN family beta-propeller protein
MHSRGGVVCLALGAALTVGLGGLGAASVRGGDKTRPSAPKVHGPRQTASLTPTYRFRSSDPDNRASSLRFRCSFDSSKLHGCAVRYRQRLTVGTHVLWVQAFDPAGNASPMTKVAVRVSGGTPPPGTPPAGKLVATIPIAHSLGPIAVGEGAVWIENRDATVSKIDPATNTVAATITMPYAIPGGYGGSIATGDGSVWAVNNSTDDRVSSMTRIDAGTGAIVTTIPVAAGPSGIAVTPAGVWVANHHAVSLQRIDPATNKVVATVAMASEPEGIVYAAGSLWSTELDADRLGVYDLERRSVVTGAIVARIVGPSGHFSFASDGSSAYLGAFDENKIYPLDLATNTLGSPFDAQAPFTLAVGLGALWSAAGGLIRYDPATGAIKGKSPFIDSGGLDIGYGSVWVGGASKLLRFEPQ